MTLREAERRNRRAEHEAAARRRAEHEAYVAALAWPQPHRLRMD